VYRYKKTHISTETKILYNNCSFWKIWFSRHERFL